VVCVLLSQTNNMVAFVAEMVTDISWSGLVPGAMENYFNIGYTLSISESILMWIAA
jgi:hypothetical protein